MLDVRRLRILVEVAERKSFQRAAEALSFTQPSVSRHIAALEREAGVALLERTRGGVRLTGAGEIAVRHAKVVIAHLDRAEAELRDYQRADGGRLRLAAFPSANAWLIPAGLQLFAKRHPDVELGLSGGRTSDHVPRLLSGEIDVALLTNWDHLTQVASEDVALVPLLDDPMLLAVAASHRLALGSRPIDLDEIVEETWIEGAHPDCLGPLGELDGGVGFRPRVNFICEDLGGKQALVARGMGITLLPSLAAPAARPDIVLRPLEPRVPPRQVFAAYRADGYQVPAVHEMIKLLGQIARERSRTPRQVTAIREARATVRAVAST